ncbi:NADH dehydrogenase [ubiquinone] 1 alpha subcomplex assembly factor 3-like isoform X1 [Acropora millepora]|uniref:NADH dehydrogenase [ubiquinone] 1 alpha subcomplex assembly factor 3-like isoform X1 n=1 Tax=Acropora millepora TaxID=45264 RepID=UPI001CF41D42|nr:NADH dehydrogenase [ubiquinone] 1 alpha subcomplex assembly factor 3-like isoform X1 [Acropora millepora]
MATLFRCSKYILRRSTSIIPRRFEQHSVEKEPFKTTVTFITDIKEKDGMKSYPPYVTSYSSQGFNIKGIKVVGSVAILPTIFYHWRIKRPEDITAESLSLFTIMEPPIEIVVVGTGDKLFRLDPKLHSYMRKQHNILLEVQATANASATFNFLLEETRLVGAVLIPPTSTDEP